MSQTAWTPERTAEAIRRERDRGYTDAEIAQLFRACPRSFPPPLADLPWWDAYTVRVAGRRGSAGRIKEGAA
jgi:hypothetical protein